MEHHADNVIKLFVIIKQVLSGVLEEYLLLLLLQTSALQTMQYALPNNDGGWYNPPLKHFDMAQPVWQKIGIYQGGIVPVIYQRVPCVKRGGARFTINGRDYFELLLISNVGGAGSIKSVQINGTRTNWMSMSRNWGANWQSSAYLNGQALSFRVTTTDGVTKISIVVSSGWRFGQTFSSSVKF